MRVIVVGPGRAGTALAMAAHAAGHEVVAVMARRMEAAEDAAASLGAARAVLIGNDVPPSDLIVVATRDDTISEVAGEIAPSVREAGGVVHISGLASIEALAPIARVGVATGSFHPLQTFPTPEAGAAGLPGAWIGVTTRNRRLRGELHELARSLGSVPFDLADEAKGLYHAAASAASNFLLASLVMAADLFEEAGVPFEAARPLVEAAVSNAFELGPRSGLTGPVARGDVATVEAQLAAVTGSASSHARAFKSLVSELALLTGRAEQFRDLVHSEGSEGE